MRFSLFLLPLALLLAGAAPPKALRVERFGKARRPATLLIVVHDGDDARARTAYDFARESAEGQQDLLAFAVVRPGFADRKGRASPGDRGTGNGDDYTRATVDWVGNAVASLKRRYPKARTLLVGDGGGAAITANLAGLHPGLVDGMVLVSCPCALPEWRKYMAKRHPEGGWANPVASLDPLRTAGGLSPALKAALIVGADDQTTPAQFSRPYAEALALRGIDTDYRILPGRRDAILTDPEVLSATRELAAALPGKR
jgi:pimeloyl-ACP methyl ester carboxylesterase